MNWIKRIIARVARLFGYRPKEAIISDFFPKGSYERYLAQLHEAAQIILAKYARQKKQWANRPRVKLGAMVRVTPGGRHAFYESNVGLIRKPYVQA